MDVYIKIIQKYSKYGILFLINICNQKILCCKKRKNRQKKYYYKRSTK